MTQDFGMSAARNDVLSEVLTLIRLRGELVYTAVLGAPSLVEWSLRPNSATRTSRQPATGR